MRRPIKTIGIDPGLAATGIGIVSGSGHDIRSHAYGGIRTSKRDALPERLNQIYSKLVALLKEEAPNQMVVEDVFSLEKYPSSGITLGKVTGVILLAGCRAGVSVVSIPVREAKQVLTGNGNASKIQLEKAVRHVLNIASPIRPFHASDALALALIGMFRAFGIPSGQG